MAAAAEAPAAVPNYQVRNLHIDEDDEDSILFRSLPGGSGCTIFEGTADVGVLQQSVDVAVKVFPKEWFVGRPALKRKKQIKEEYLRLRAAAEAVEGGGICKVYGLVEDANSWADNKQKHKLCIVMKKYDGTLMDELEEEEEEGRKLQLDRAVSVALSLAKTIMQLHDMANRASCTWT